MALSILANTIWNSPKMMANQNIFRSEKNRALMLSGIGSISASFMPKNVPENSGMMSEPTPSQAISLP